MIPSPRIISFIKGFESCRLKAYLPTPRDHPTIGWGSTGPDIALGLTWTQAECDNRFLDDLRSVGDRLTEIIGAASTSQDQFDAMLSLAYNAGPSIYHSSLMIYHREGRYEHAAAEFLQWDHQAGEVLPGLLRRREAEAAIYQGSSNHV